MAFIAAAKLCRAVVGAIVFHDIFDSFMTLETSGRDRIRLNVLAFAFIEKIVLTHFSGMTDGAHEVDRWCMSVFSGSKYFMA